MAVIGWIAIPSNLTNRFSCLGNSFSEMLFLQISISFHQWLSQEKVEPLESCFCGSAPITGATRLSRSFVKSENLTLVMS